MYFAQHYLDCLSQASYLIGDERSGRAVVVDPRRDIEVYLADAAEHGLRIEGVVMTHFHADFLAGHLELAGATGAWIGYGPSARTEYPIRHLADGERVDLGLPGGVVLQIMHTPGHTPEAISVLVYEHGGDEVPYGVLTGDALFIGDVGRPDLLASVGVSAEELGAMLHDSVQHKLMGLPDAVRVFPAHGAGSACGKNLSTATRSTVGEQRSTNPACLPMPPEQFVRMVTQGQPAPPAYFGYDARRNKENRATYHHDDVPALAYPQVRDAVARGSVVLDTRDADEFTAGHLRGSLSVPLDGRFAETSGIVLTPQDSVVIVAAPGRETEAATRLARIGFDNVAGYLPLVEAVLTRLDPAQIGHASRLTPAGLDAVLTRRSDVVLIDVRNPVEVADGMIPGARHIPLAQLPGRAAQIPADRPVVLTCAGGWRSSVAAGYLRAHGFTDVSDLIGGYDAWLARRRALATPA
ncbi:MAG: MBL fold metallo-hydrolase [Jatrophihabitans sp.]|nr:MAG: MBL fold metallo-hydrolase [Jatrophihabitans sp.]